MPRSYLPAPKTSALRNARLDWFERAAVSASMLCLLHCLALPLLIASRILTIPETFHLWVLALAVPTSAAALLAGRARHGATWPVATGCLGLALLALGAITFGETSWETPITVSGSLTLATAHIGNWRLRHRTHQHG